MGPVLNTPRLSLRWLRNDDSDVEFMLRLMNDSAFIKNIGDRGVRTVEEARAYLQEKIIVPGYEKNGFGPFLAEMSLSKTPLGLVSLIKREFLEDIDIGYAFLPEHTGQGFAFEATREVLRFARDEMRLKKIVAFTVPHNEKSKVLLRRLGFEFLKQISLPDTQGEGDLFELKM